jgi:trehalose/maltose transport system substrate-binding protein
MLWTNKVNNGPPGVSAGEGRYAAGENMGLPIDSLEICGFRRLPVTARVARREALGHARALVLILPAFLVFCVSCSRHSSDEPKTITFVDPEWSHDLTERNVLPDERLQEFTRQSGIEVKHLPTPEPALDQLTMVRNLLKERSSSPDVLGVDVIWPGILSSDMIDLKPYFASELSSLDPNLVASYSVKGKLVAVPFHSDLGVLFYRKDLLREYGYSAPPDTWDQLEKMAARVQKGERAKGKSDFWGYVWPGAAGEGLTCNALEWQAAEAGGRIIEADDTISVNNPNTIRAWQRAAHWIGTISSPNVISYQEWEAINAFYSGKATFFRGWASSYFLAVEAEANPAIRDTAKIDSSKIGIIAIPSGKGGQAATLGGFGLGVSQSTVHSADALKSSGSFF